MIASSLDGLLVHRRYKSRAVRPHICSHIMKPTYIHVGEQGKPSSIEKKKKENGQMVSPNIIKSSLLIIHH
jgi:hypothetical protein